MVDAAPSGLREPPRGRARRVRRIEDALDPAPAPEDLRAALHGLPPTVRRYLRELRIRAEVAEEALRMIASGEAPGLRLDDRPQVEIDAEARRWLVSGILDTPEDTKGPPAGRAESL